jgi:prepilin-type N-terminal cleavage/methylation domain-containing protein
MKRRGLTLIEIAISIALISLVVLWSINVINNLGKGSATTSDMEIATLLASQKIEELKTKSYSELSQLTFPTKGTFSSPYNQFSYEIVFTSSQSSGNYYITRATIHIYKGSPPTGTELIKIDANFVRRTTDGKDIGL